MNSYQLPPVLRLSLVPFLACSLLLIGACKNSRRKGTDTRKVISVNYELFAEEDFATTLSSIVKPVDSGKVDSQSTVVNPFVGLRKVYAGSNYLPVWVAESGVTDAAELLIKDLDSLRLDGINPERYHVKDLTAALEDLKKNGDLNKAIAFDTACTHAYLMASHDLLMGLVKPSEVDSLWYHTNDTSWEAPKGLVAMSNGGAYEPLSKYRSTIPTYALLRTEYARYSSLAADAGINPLKNTVTGKNVPDSVATAIIKKELPWLQTSASDSLSENAQMVRNYQEYHGLQATGKKDTATIARLRMAPTAVRATIAANMERLRWMPRQFEDQYVLVDVPLMELFYRRDGVDAMNMRVVVGKPARQTPSLNANMANVVFSPSWGVPPTILKNDVLPGIQRSGAAYLHKKDLEAFDRKGRKVHASAINASNIKNYTFKQPPGDDNALGDVKFNLPNKWDIYLHDTPHREDFVKRYRAKSSGCIRLEQPRELAQFILADVEGRAFDLYKIDSIVQTRKTRFEQLKTKIPVHIVYLTAFEDRSNQHIRLIPDIYKRDGKLIAALTM